MAPSNGRSKRTIPVVRSVSQSPRETGTDTFERRRRSSNARIAQTGDIAYRDFDLGRSVVPKTRTELDTIAYKNRTIIAPRRREGGFVTLRKIARWKVAESFGNDGVLDALDFRHRFHARSMLQEISQQMDGRIPFSTWLAFTTRIPLDDIPKNRRTYRGLVLGDAKELESIREANEQSLQRWREETIDLRGEPLPLPPCFLGILDLSNDQTIRDGDVWKFRSTIAPFLVYLNLSLTQLTDSGISTIAAGYGEEDAYTKLEVLILHHVSFTDAIAKKLARFTTLRMLGEFLRHCCRITN